MSLQAASSELQVTFKRKQEALQVPVLPGFRRQHTVSYGPTCSGDGSGSLAEPGSGIPRTPSGAAPARGEAAPRPSQLGRSIPRNRIGI